MQKDFFDELITGIKGITACTQKLTYYLLTSSVSEEYCDLKVYGVEIDRVAEYADGKRESDKKIISDLFFSREEAETFLERILKKEVTPIGLKNAVHDYIGERLQIRNVKSV